MYDHSRDIDDYTMYPHSIQKTKLHPRPTTYSFPGFHPSHSCTVSSEIWPRISAPASKFCPTAKDSSSSRLFYSFRQPSSYTSRFFRNSPSGKCHIRPSRYFCSSILDMVYYIETYSLYKMESKPSWNSCSSISPPKSRKSVENKF